MRIRKIEKANNQHTQRSSAKTVMLYNRAMAEVKALKIEKQIIIVKKKQKSLET